MQFGVLGPLLVVDETLGGDIDLGGIKQQTVLAALLLAKGQVLSNDRLIDAVWGDRPPSKPHVTLRSYVSHLRRVLEPERATGERTRRIITRAPGYALAIAPEELDCWQFELEVAEARRLAEQRDVGRALETSEQALGRWRVADLRSGPLESFEADIVRLEELRRLARRIRHDAMLALGRHDGAVPLLEQALADDPYDEGTRGQLMVALYRGGRQADALAVYQDGRRRLIDDLGLEPSTELRELEARILSDDSSLRREPSPGARLRVSGTGTVAPSAPPGRTADAEAIAEQLDAAIARSRGSLIVVTGEPGIGKSTLLRHASELARQRGFQVAIGRCHDGSHDATLFPWITAFRDLIELVNNEELAWLVGSSGAPLAHLLPEVADRLAIEPQFTSDRATLFDLVLRGIQRGAQLAPLCIVLEDLHWADEHTVRLVEVAAEALQDRRVVLMVSWRDTESVSPEIRARLADVATKTAPLRLLLGGLSAEDIAAVLRDTAPDAELDVARLAQRTGGNPLFVGELIRSAQATGELVSSPTVRDAILGRLRRLPTGTAETLRVGALCLDGFSETMLARVLDLDEDAVLDQLEAALAARLIEEDPNHDERFRFTHDLFAETLLDTMSTPRRARMNTRLGLALEAQRAPATELAHYFLHGSGDVALLKGAEYAHRAAVLALGLFDFDGASRLLEAGLAAIEGRDDDDPLLIDLLFDLMQVRKHQERYLDVHRLAEEAFTVARRSGDVRRMCAVALRFEGFAVPEGADRDTWLGYWTPAGVIIPMLEACIEKVPEDDPILASLWAALGQQYFGPFEDDAVALRCFDRSIAVARHSGNSSEIAHALHRKHDALQRSLSIDERAALLDEVVSFCDPDRAPIQSVAARRSLAVVALDRGDLDAAVRQLEIGDAVAVRSGRPTAAMNIEVGRIALLLFQGHLDQVAERIESGFSTYERFGVAMLDQFGLQLSALWREQGKNADVVSLLEWKLQGYPGPAYSAPLAVVLSELGRNDEAAAVIERFSLLEQTRGGEGVLQFMTPMFFAEAAANLGDVVLAERLVPALEPANDRLVSMFDGIHLFGSGSYFSARLAITLGRFDEATRLLDVADAHHRRLDAHLANLRVELSRADLALARGDIDGVERALETAEGYTLRLGQRWRLDQWVATHPF